MAAALSPWCLVLLGLSLTTCSSPPSPPRRERSVLVYPSGGAIRLILLMVLPASKKPAINLVNSFQLVYADPRNTTQLYPHTPYIERRSNGFGVDLLTRAVAYGALARALDSRGTNGSACILRTICEVAETPLHHDGLLGEILHLFFTLDETSSYADAWREGNQGSDCRLSYPTCGDGHGILDVISMIDT